MENYLTKIDNYEKRDKQKTFDIYQHIAFLDNQIQEEIKLLGYISTTNDTDIKKWMQKLSNIGDYAKLREEFEW